MQPTSPPPPNHPSYTVEARVPVADFVDPVPEQFGSLLEQYLTTIHTDRAQERRAAEAAALDMAARRLVSRAVRMLLEAGDPPDWRIPVELTLDDRPGLGRFAVARCVLWGDKCR